MKLVFLFLVVAYGVYIFVRYVLRGMIGVWRLSEADFATIQLVKYCKEGVVYSCNLREYQSAAFIAACKRLFVRICGIAVIVWLMVRYI